MSGDLNFKAELIYNTCVCIRSSGSFVGDDDPVDDDDNDDGDDDVLRKQKQTMSDAWHDRPNLSDNRENMQPGICSSSALSPLFMFDIKNKKVFFC